MTVTAASEAPAETCPARWHDYSDYSNGHCIRSCFPGRVATALYRQKYRARKKAERLARESSARLTRSGDLPA